MSELLNDIRKFYLIPAFFLEEKDLPNCFSKEIIEHYNNLNVDERIKFILEKLRVNDENFTKFLECSFTNSKKAVLDEKFDQFCKICEKFLIDAEIDELLRNQPILSCVQVVKYNLTEEQILEMKNISLDMYENFSKILEQTCEEDVIKEIANFKSSVNNENADAFGKIMRVLEEHQRSLVDKIFA